MTPKTLLLTGVLGIGKTTLLQKVVSSLVRYRIRGFISDEIKQDGKRVDGVRAQFECLFKMKEFERLCVNIVNDFEIPKEKREALRVLLNSCFPDYFIQREYFKQIPKFRYLVWDEEKLVAQMGVENRVINIDGDIVRIFGVIDLCVEDGYRSHNIATNLLERVEYLGLKNGIDFIILFADDHRLYRKNGYRLVSNICRWLAIDELRSVEIIEKRLTNCFMVKSLSQKSWKNGQVDLLGYLF